MTKKVVKKNVTPVAKPSPEEDATEEVLDDSGTAKGLIDKDIESAEENGNSSKGKNEGTNIALVNDDDKELQLEKYDGTCEKCNGRTRSDMNHIEDLMLRISKTKKRTAALLLHSHWPHFSDISRLMQFYCSHCRLHFRGCREFLIHTIRCQTEEGFKKDMDSKSSYSEDLGDKHTASFRSFIKCVQKIDKEGPNTNCLAYLEEFLCENTPRYFETAYRTGNYGDNIDKDAKVDSSNGDFLIHEYEYQTATGGDPEKYLVEDMAKDDIPLSGPLCLHKKLIAVSKSEIDTITSVPSSEEKKSAKEVVKKPYNLLQCMVCNDAIQSVRHHLNEVFWIRPQSKNVKFDPRERHLTFMLSGMQMGTKNDTENNRSMFCPVCNYHLQSRRAYIHLMTHLKHICIMTKKKSNLYIAKHVELIDFLMDLFVKRISGDISAKYMAEMCDKKFICNEGGEYTGFVPAKTLPLQPDKIVISAKRPATSAISGSKQPKVPRMLNWKNTTPINKSNQSQGKSMPQLMQFQSGGKQNKFQNQPQQQQQFQQQKFQQQKFNTNSINQSQTVACDLCQTRVAGLEGLRDHLRQALFMSGPRVAEVHLTCFPKPLAYNNDCQCPACGIRQSSFASCLEHICQHASNMIGDKHMVAANVLIDKYINCMCRQITLNDVATFVKQAYSMRIW